MKPLCEIVVKEVLPGLRASLANKLLQKGLTQTEVAKILGVTQGAVSQYMRSIRGRQSLLIKEKEIDNKINELANSIINSPDQAKIMIEFCNICKLMRKKKMLCSRHKEMFPFISDCSICH